MSLNNSFKIENYPKKLGKNLVIFQTNLYVDVFFGDGWTQHTRFKRDHNKKLIRITKEALPKHIHQQVLNSVGN